MENIEKIPRPPYPRHDFEPLTAAVHPSGTAFACAGGTVLDVRNADGSLRKAAPLMESATRVSFSPDGTTLLVGSYDARVSAYDAASLEPRAKTPALYEAVEDLAWLGPAHFAAASSRGEVNLYELSSMRLVGPIAPPELDYAQLGGICATADGSHLFLAVGQKISCYDTRTAQPVWTYVRPQTDYETGAIALAPDASWLVMGTRDGLSFVEARSGRPGPTFRWTCAEAVSWPGQEHNTWKPRPIFARDGSYVLVNDRAGNLVRISTQRIACAEQAPRQQGLAWINHLELFPDGQRMLVLGTDNTASVWQLEPFTGLAHTRAVEPLPESAYDRLYSDGDDYDDEDDHADEDDDYDDDYAR